MYNYSIPSLSLMVTVATFGVILILLILSLKPWLASCSVTENISVSSIMSLLIISTGKKQILVWHIRESVDSLYRDDTGEISRDPRTKRLKTRWESLPRPSKHTSNSLRAHIYLYVFPKISYAPSVVHARIRSYAISRFSSSSSSSLNPLSPYQYQFKRWFLHRRSPISPEVCTDIKRSFISRRNSLR